MGRAREGQVWRTSVARQDGHARCGGGQGAQLVLGEARDKRGGGIRGHVGPWSCAHVSTQLQAAVASVLSQWPPARQKRRVGTTRSKVDPGRDAWTPLPCALWLAVDEDKPGLLSSAIVT